MGRAKLFQSQFGIHTRRGGVFGPDILNHFSNVKYLALAQGRTGLLLILPPPQKGSDLAAGRVLSAWTAEARGRTQGRACACRTRSSPARPRRCCTGAGDACRVRGTRLSTDLRRCFFFSFPFRWGGSLRDARLEHSFPKLQLRKTPSAFSTVSKPNPGPLLWTH